MDCKLLSKGQLVSLPAIATWAVIWVPIRPFGSLTNCSLIWALFKRDFLILGKDLSRICPVFLRNSPILLFSQLFFLESCNGRIWVSITIGDDVTIFCTLEAIPRPWLAACLSSRNLLLCYFLSYRVGLDFGTHCKWLSFLLFRLLLFAAFHFHAAKLGTDVSYLFPQHLNFSTIIKISGVWRLKMRHDMAQEGGYPDAAAYSSVL